MAKDNDNNENSNQGFNNMPKEKVRKIASKGGKARQNKSDDSQTQD